MIRTPASQIGHGGNGTTVTGTRVRLRAWRDSDLPAFAALNADPEVMRYFPAPLRRIESDARARSAQADLTTRGWGKWAVATIADDQLIGQVGLAYARLDLPFSPCVELGYRLARCWWGQGLTTEAARLALEFGFLRVGLPEIVAFTASVNHPSQGVMRRLGMIRDLKEFDHPELPPGHALRRHVVYRLRREQWLSVSSATSRAFADAAHVPPT